MQLALTDSGAVVLASRIGPSVEALEGTFLGDSAGSYLLSMHVTRARSGVETDWKGERVAVPHVLTTSILQRSFSPTQTGLAAVLAAVGLVGITTALRGEGSANGMIPDKGPPGPQ